MTPRQILSHIGSAPWLHRFRYTKPAPWRPLTDEEWEYIRPLLVDTNAPGRPMQDPRGRFDACLYGACMPGAWESLPERFGRPDTVSRCFRRWAHRGVWDNLLIWAASGRFFLPQLEYMICRAFRRAGRLLGLAGLKLARRAGLLTALRAPPHWLPDPDLSEYLHKRVLAPALAHPAGQYLPTRAECSLWKTLYSVCIGRRRIPRCAAPP
jgi:transposase